MSKPKLTYFDAPISRGEECRLALHIAGVDFEDHRIARAEWLALKPTTPFGSLPLLEFPGQPVLAQSNAILVLVGRRYGLHPTDDFQAARHEAVMAHVEDLRNALGPSMRLSDEAEKIRVRAALATDYLPVWAAYTEAQIGDGPFFDGAKLQVVDLKLHLTVRWLTGGSVDHIPTSIFSNYPKLNRLHEAVQIHPGVKSWYAKS